MRYAIIRKTDAYKDFRFVERALPTNYQARIINADTIEVSGNDHAGWTLDGYVLPRLASGNVWATEVFS